MVFCNFDTILVNYYKPYILFAGEWNLATASRSLYLFDIGENSFQCYLCLTLCTPTLSSIRVIIFILQYACILSFSILRIGFNFLLAFLLDFSIISLQLA